MAENSFLKLFLWASAFPFILVSRFLEAIRARGIMFDIQNCLLAIDSANHVPKQYLDALIAAEDHRNALHPGVDPIAMTRALAARVLFSRNEGASTIEQQFVRVVTNRYERSLSRKLKEQVLALSIARRRSKKQIAAAYLSIAYFGTLHRGLHYLAINYREPIEHAGMEFVLGAISRLKYPEPPQRTECWEVKITNRAGYIRRRAENKANKALQSDQSTMSCLSLSREPRHRALAAE